MTQLERMEGLLSDGSVWRMSALVGQGVAAATVRRALAAGTVEAIARGVYRLRRAPRADGLDLAGIASRVPGGLVCLHSAAEFHGLGDVACKRAWIAILHTQAVPRFEWPPVRFLRWRNPERFDVGVEERIIAGVNVRMTGAARTVVDMLALPELADEGRALACLRDFVSVRRGVGELPIIAERLGVGRKISPFLKAAAAFGGAK